MPKDATHLQRLAPANGARDRRADRRASSLPRRVLATATLVLLGSLGGAPGVARDDSKEQMQSLDEQVQEIKADVLRIATELGRLEEKLLYPSDTQVAVFVALAEGASFRLDSVHVKIDGGLAAEHIYSFKELEALRKGGVQRLYTGNLASGEHRLDVSIAGKLASGKDFARTGSFPFRKDVGPKLVGMTLAAGDSGDASIQLAGW